jgi:acetyltransferase-like isoleucine patch superfamily enzyme
MIKEFDSRPKLVVHPEQPRVESVRMNSRITPHPALTAVATTNLNSLFARLLFRIRRGHVRALIRTAILRFYGVKIGKRTLVPAVSITWPHQLQIGNNCVLEPDIFFKFDGVWSPGPSIIIQDGVFIGRGCEFNIKKKITIGQGSALASGCKFIDHEHGVDGAVIDEAPGLEEEIEIGQNVLIGANAVILKGVVIGNGAVIGAGAIVTKSVPAFEIWAGVPAKQIKQKKNHACCQYSRE